MFDRDGFIADCTAAMASGGGQRAIRELMREAALSIGPMMEM